jgi:hypothetical protein
MSQANNGNADVTWASFFDDEIQDDFDGFDGCMGGGVDEVEQRLLDDSPQATESDAKGLHFDPAAAEADRDTDSWNRFDDSLEGIGETANTFRGVELPEEASELPEGISEQNVTNFDSVLNVKDDVKFDQQEAYASHSQTSILSLRQWIERSTGEDEFKSTAISSPAYITSAIKIAIDLTTQIIDAEDLYESGVHDKLDMLPLSAAHDWAEHVVVQFVVTQSSAESNRGDINAQVEEILHQFEQQRIARQGQVHDDALVSEQDRACRNGLEDVSKHPPGSTPNSDSCIEDCLDVKSAHIQCPASDSPSNPENAHMQRIFYLGLVFYELFSGGQRPPSKLCALASSERAFESLSTKTAAQDSNAEDQFIGTNKRLQSGNQDGGPCRVYCEYLKISNVKSSLCDLILNMLNCVCGVFAGTDSYLQLREVQFDLQLMLDKPKILRGLNMDALSSQSQGSQLDEISVSREQEVESILSCYRRCMSGSFEIAIIKGSSGSGKSYLANIVGKSIAAEGGIFLLGKFDQVEQSRPFSGLTAALDQYCALLIDQLGSDWVNSVVDKLQSALGRDASYLIKIIPKLSAVLDQSTTTTHSPPDDQNNLGNAVQRIHYLLCLFVETISLSSTVAVTLCLDDVQWMDAASISVVRRVLAQGYNKFFFMACCRHDEMSDTHPFWGMIESVCANGLLSVSVELKNVDANTLENVISDLLCLPPRLVKPLAGIVHRKTKGLPLFVSEMLRALNRDGLLLVDLDGQRWVWDQDKICVSRPSSSEK